MAVSPTFWAERDRDMDIPELMTVADFLARYSVSRSSFYREVAAGRIKLRKFGTASRVARNDAETWAERLPMVTGGQA